MATMTTLTALLLAVGIQVTTQQTCHLKDLQGCVLKLTEFADNNPIPLPTNEEELEKQCAILADVRGCAYNYSLKCVSELGRNLGDIILTNTAQKMRDLCTTGHEINAMYLRNAKCIADNYDGVNPCAKTGLAGLESLPKLHWRERLPGFCCTIGQFRSCIADHFRKACNEEVVTLTNMIIEFGLSDLASEACITIENAVTCPGLPPPGTPLDGSYNKNLVGILVNSFIKS